MDNPSTARHLGLPEGSLRLVRDLEKQGLGVWGMQASDTGVGTCGPWTLTVARKEIHGERGGH